MFALVGIKPPWGGFIPPKGVVLTRGGGFIPHKGWFYPPKVVVLSPKRGGFIPHKSGHKTTRGGFRGGFIPHLGVVLCPGPLHNLHSFTCTQPHAQLRCHAED